MDLSMRKKNHRLNINNEIKIRVFMSIKRIEIHLDSKEAKLLDVMAKQEGRSRKNFCENEIRKLIEAYFSRLKTESNKDHFTVSPQISHRY